MTTTTSSPGLDIAAAAELRTLDITVLSGGPSAQNARSVCRAAGPLRTHSDVSAMRSVSQTSPQTT